MTNYHIHLIYSERKLKDRVEEKAACCNMFYDETGRHVRTKKEILDADGKDPARFIRILKKAIAVLIEKARSFRPSILASLERFKTESAEQDRQHRYARKVVKDREQIPERGRRKSR